MHSDPTTVFNAAATAFLNGDYRMTASLCDPVSLVVFKRHYVERIEQGPVREITAEDLMRVSPEKPREVAEYQAAAFRQDADPRHILDDLPGIASIQALREADPQDVFAAWLQAQTPQYQIRRAVSFGFAPPEVERAVDQLGHFREFVVLGTVPDGDRVSHIVYRERYVDSPHDIPDHMLGGDFSELSSEEQEFRRDLVPGPVFTMAARRQSDGTWRLVAGEKFLNMGTYAVGFESDADGYTSPA